MEVDGAGEYFSLISPFLPHITTDRRADCVIGKISAPRVAVIGEFEALKAARDEPADIRGLP